MAAEGPCMDVMGVHADDTCVTYSVTSLGIWDDMWRCR